MLMLFPPDLMHWVEPHRGTGLRLSVAFNLGPAAEPPNLALPESPS
jgi:hypothetical protein